MLAGLSQAQLAETPQPLGGLLQKHLLAFRSVFLILVYCLEKKEERKEKKEINIGWELS